MYIDNKLIFIAGGTGLAGTSIMCSILESHPSARIRATYSQTEPFIKDERVEYVHGDLTSQSDCRRMVRGCDAAIMAAAFTAGSGVLTSQPHKYVNENLIMNSQMLEAFNSEGVKRVVYIGTASAYQEFEGTIKEEQLDYNQDPHEAYFGVGWVARYLEKICKFWHDKYGMEIVIARAANIYGPYAKFDPLTANFIPAIIRKATDKMDPFEVWGSPYVTRDVVFSEDFGRGIAIMLDNDAISFDVFNIGSGIRTTVENVVEWSLMFSGHKPSEIKYLSDMPVTIRYRGLDCSKANNMLGWKPKYTPEEGLKKTLEWWTKNRSWWKK